LFKPVHIKIPDILKNIRLAWLQNISTELAQDAKVRVIFKSELNRFYDSLCKVIETGETTWIEPILFDWCTSPPLSNPEEGGGISSMLSKMLVTTLNVGRENLSSDETLELLTSVLPVFTFSLEKVSIIEMKEHLSRAANKLYGAQRKLERLDQSKSNFISVAAHELKTPLTLIEGYTAMIHDETINVSTKQLDTLFDGVNSGIIRLQSIIEDMIDVSLIDNNMLSLNFQPIWMNKLLLLIKTEFRQTIKERSLTLDIKAFSGFDQVLFGDPERLHQAFRNILNNAIKFTPDDGSIVVDGRILPGFQEITITDSGIGISPENRDAIFEKFGQL
jgi:signal transduction histidine kinase